MKNRGHQVLQTCTKGEKQRKITRSLKSRISDRTLLVVGITRTVLGVGSQDGKPSPRSTGRMSKEGEEVSVRQDSK